jgi:hypothetical protein
MKKILLLGVILLVCAAAVSAQVKSKRFSFGADAGGLPDLYASIEFTDSNGNKILENRESGKISMTLTNKGKGKAEGIVVTVRNLAEDPELKISEPKKVNFLMPGDSIALEFTISASKQIRTQENKMEILVTENGSMQDMDPAYLILPTLAYDPPKLQFAGLEVVEVGEDVDVKKADGQLQPKERVYIRVVVQNVGQSAAPNVSYSLENTHQSIRIEQTSGTLGTMQPGEWKEFRFKITTPSLQRMADIKDALPLYLTVTNDELEGRLEKFQLPLKIDQPPVAQNIVEVKPRLDNVKKTFAKFELSNKFKANIDNVIDVRSVTPAISKRPNSIGVVIGVEEYKDLAPAPFAANDATVMAEYFKKVLGVEQVIVLKNDEVTYSRLDDIFNPRSGELASAVKKNETDVFVFYSGHGIPDKNGDVTYLFPSDGKIANLENRAYPLPKFYSDLNSLAARSVTVMLDACFSGSARKTQSTLLANLTGQKGIKLKINRPWESYNHFTVINSSTSDETSLGFDEAQMGLFTYFMAAGLKGYADKNQDHKITLGELKEYVIANVTETSRKKSGLQTPEIFGDESQILVEYP